MSAPHGQTKSVDEVRKRGPGVEAFYCDSKTQNKQGIAPPHFSMPSISTISSYPMYTSLRSVIMEKINPDKLANPATTSPSPRQDAHSAARSSSAAGRKPCNPPQARGPRG